MAESEPGPWLQPAAVHAVMASTGATSFAVQRAAWAHVAPDLPPEVAAMVAPPITVSSAPVTGLTAADERRRADLMRYRMNMASVPAVAPGNGRHRRPARTA